MKPSAHKRPAEKLPASPIPPKKLEQLDEDAIIDEAVDESFPASDPPNVTQPGSTLAVKKIAEEGRETPEPEPEQPKPERSRRK